MKKSEKKPERVLIFRDDEWAVDVISVSDTHYPITWEETSNCVIAYLKYGNGSVMRRITSILMRLFTCSLKPKQTSPSGKCGTTTSPGTSSRTE